MNTREMTEVIQADEDGAEIEFSRKNVGDWTYVNKPGWNFYAYDYRVKKKSVKMYKYALRDRNSDWRESEFFFTDDSDFIKVFNKSKEFKRLDYTMIEVEA